MKMCEHNGITCVLFPFSTEREVNDLLLIDHRADSLVFEICSDWVLIATRCDELPGPFKFINKMA